MTDKNPPSETPALHTTKDGSSTLYSPRYDQFYHNPNGAVSESLHVFFEQTGLIQDLRANKALTIIETGFGTGLNFLLLADLYLKMNCTAPVQFYSVEAYPVSEETAAEFNFSKHLHHPELESILPGIFGRLKDGMNTLKPVLNADIELKLFNGFFSDLEYEGAPATYFIHDAFSPDVNPELWTCEAFTKLRSAAAPDAVLGTYCAASKARAAMAAAGWLVARAPGALGKREMTLASPDEKKLGAFKRVNEERLIRRLEEGDFNG